MTLKEFEEASKEKKHLQCNLMEEVLMHAEKKKKKQAEWGSAGWVGQEEALGQGLQSWEASRAHSAWATPGSLDCLLVPVKPFPQL